MAVQMIRYSPFIWDGLTAAYWRDYRQSDDRDVFSLQGIYGYKGVRIGKGGRYWRSSAG